MKKLKLMVSMVALSFATMISAQNTSEKWLIGLGMHATDHTSVRGTFDGYFDTKDYSFSFPLSKLTVSRSIAKNLAVDMQASISNMDNKRLGVEDETFFLGGLGLRWMPLSESGKLKWLDPYLRIGANYHRYAYKGNVQRNPETGNIPAYDHDYDPDKNYELGGEYRAKDDMFVLNGGVGINFWFTKNIGLNIESQYNWVTNQTSDYADFFQHSASIIFKFGKSDKDKDGIPDKEDKCPEIPGLAEFQGCPDTDGDGIPDPEDNCPNTAGPKENGGCPWPDTDGDGVADKDDRCPDVAGLAEFQGCPDIDGDGIPDIDDKCPNEAGLPEFQGCPDTDGDGISDLEDKCPKVAGPKENDGCPWEVKDVTYRLKNINFEFNSSKLTSESLPLVNEAAKMLNDNAFADKKFYVDGHTDHKGSDKVNNRISKQRAQAVVDVLVKDGVSADRLEARGLGKTELLCTQADINKKTDENGVILYPTQEICDLTNRRVVVLDQNTGKKVSVTKEVKVKNTTKKK